MSSPLETKVRIDQICRGCELEISGMDWLTAHQVVIDCDCMRVTAYTPDGTCVVFQENRHDASPHTMYNSRWHEQLMGWLASLTLEDEVRQNMSLPRVVC